MKEIGDKEDYIDGILKIIHSDIIDDFVIATGITISLREMATKIFKYFDLDFEKYLLIDESLYRPYEIPRSALNPEKFIKKFHGKHVSIVIKLLKICVKVRLSKFKNILYFTLPN